MGKCIKCSEWFPPDYVFLIETKEESESGEDIFKCVFCERDIEEVTIVEDATGKEEKYKKEDVIKDYKIFLKKLKEDYEKKGNIKKIITP